MKEKLGIPILLLVHCLVTVIVDGSAALILATAKLSSSAETTIIAVASLITLTMLLHVAWLMWELFKG